MVLKSEIEKAYHLQQFAIKAKDKTVSRHYLQKINPTSKLIEVISGIRRCGKSTLMKQIVKKHYKNVGYFNFEDSRIYGFEVSDFPKLEDIIGLHKEAYFFDEIQNVPQWELFIRQLHDKGKKIFITGSNASLLSKELGTRLTGRHLRHELFPFSYQEYLSFKNERKGAQSLETFIEQGGFPEFIRDENNEVLQTLLKDIVLRDIAVRYGIKNTRVLMDITHFLISNIGKEVSYNNLKKSFSIGSATTVSDYLSWLEDSYLLFFLKKFSWSAKNSALNARKVYAIDTGMVNCNSLSFTKDKGRLLENAVYLFLNQHFESLFFFREKGECDFVVFEKNKCRHLIQVCEDVNGDNKNREVNGLIEAMDFFDKKEGLIITKNQEDVLTFDKKKITLIPAYKFMTELKT